MEDFNLVLKEATAGLHRSVEASGISRAILSPGLTPAIYTEYLRSTYRVHQAVEADVFPLLSAIVPDLAQRQKTQAIANDLRELDQEEVVKGAALLDENHNASPEFNLGMMYVTEGSVLGGQFILKHVRKVLGNEAPVAFLNVYGEHTGLLWKSFLDILNTHAAQGGEAARQTILAGAVYGFERVGHVFKAAGIPA